MLDHREKKKDDRGITNEWIEAEIEALKWAIRRLEPKEYGPIKGYSLKEWEEMGR